MRADAGLDKGSMEDFNRWDDAEVMPALLRRAEELKALSPVEFGGRRLDDGAHDSAAALARNESA